MLTAERLREVLDYDPETGVITWAVRRGNVRKGAVAGYGRKLETDGDEYIRIRLFNRNYYAHRLAWLYVHGEWPKHDIDHINGIRFDNRLANLRDVSTNMNMQNERAARRNNRIGKLGVITSGGKFSASIRFEGRLLWLGYFPTADDAHDYYLKVKRRLHDGCTI